MFVLEPSIIGAYVSDASVEQAFDPMSARVARVLLIEDDPETASEIRAELLERGYVVDWAADGRSLFVSCQIPTSSTLLGVDLQGNATPLWDQRGGFRTYAIAAPNGRELAIAGMTTGSNVWMIENY